jgi:hypothetical protein
MFQSITKQERIPAHEVDEGAVSVCLGRIALVALEAHGIAGRVHDVLDHGVVWVISRRSLSTNKNQLPRDSASTCVRRISLMPPMG